MKIKKVNFYLLLAAYIVVLGVALIILNFIKNSPDKILFIFLIASFALLLTFFTPDEEDSKARKLIYFAAQTLVISVPVILKLEFTPFLFLFFILSAQCMIVFELKEGLILVTAFALMTISSFIAYNSLLEGLTISVTYVGGYYFFGLFGYLMKTADKNRNKLESALKELSEAHEKLKDYMIKAEELAVAKERERLSQELHDTLGHYLTIASVQLEAASKLCGTDFKKSKKMMKTANSAVKNALTSLRNAVSALKNPVEGELPLRFSVEKLAEYFQKGTGIKVSLEVSENLNEPRQIRESIYRIVQELLTNIRKHSEARNVWIRLLSDDSKLNLSIIDDGKGFDFEKGNVGFGLSSIKKRVENMKGMLAIKNEESKGARIDIEIPLEANSGKD